MTDKICGLGVIGCGTFCDAYLRNLGPVYRNVRPVGCADLNTEAAQAAAARWNRTAATSGNVSGKLGNIAKPPVRYGTGGFLFAW